MKKIAITGGAGFIGSNLAATLIAQGHEVTIIDDLSTGLLSNVDRKNSEFKDFILEPEDLFPAQLRIRLQPMK
jgi:nucleoside-diphosphate-sugar epimerase